jgi:hypothetical protein
MAETTLKIPAEHVERFRAAVVGELTMDAEGLARSMAELPSILAKYPSKNPLGDVRWKVAAITDDLAALETLFAVIEGDDAELSAETRRHSDLLTQACQKMARFTADELRSSLNCDPLDRRGAMELTAAFEWALEHAEKMGDAWVAANEREAVAA